jgi:hypothetical protein
MQKDKTKGKIERWNYLRYMGGRVKIILGGGGGGLVFKLRKRPPGINVESARKIRIKKVILHLLLIFP